MRFLSKLLMLIALCFSNNSLSQEKDTAYAVEAVVDYVKENGDVKITGPKGFRLWIKDPKPCNGIELKEDLEYYVLIKRIPDIEGRAYCEILYYRHSDRQNALLFNEAIERTPTIRVEFKS